MTLAAEKEMAHVGESRAIENHDHDLVHALSSKLDAIWRYDQYIANADQNAKLQQLWQEMKQADEKFAKRLKECIAEEIAKGCF